MYMNYNVFACLSLNIDVYSITIVSLVSLEMSSEQNGVPCDINNFRD